MQPLKPCNVTGALALLIAGIRIFNGMTMREGRGGTVSCGLILNETGARPSAHKVTLQSLLKIGSSKPVEGLEIELGPRFCVYWKLSSWTQSTWDGVVSDVKDCGCGSERDRLRVDRLGPLNGSSLMSSGENGDDEPSEDTGDSGTSPGDPGCDVYSSGDPGIDSLPRGSSSLTPS